MARNFDGRPFASSMWTMGLELFGRRDQLYDPFEPGQLLDGKARRVFQAAWDAASPKTFAPV